MQKLCSKQFAEISVTVGGGDSGLDTPETPVWAHLLRRLRPWGGDSGREVPERPELDRDAIWAEKTEPNHQIEGANDGIRLWERKGS